MNASRVFAPALLALASLQVASSLLLLNWALPLFGDPPVLGNGIASAAQSLRELTEQHPVAFQRVAWVPDHLQWLFYRHLEGVLMVLGASVALLGSAAVTSVIAVLHMRRHSPE